VSITGGTYDGTVGEQFVKIKGTQGVTEEHKCEADFTNIGQDVECKVKSSGVIGDFQCIVWKTTTADGWAFNKVMNPIRCISVVDVYRNHFTETRIVSSGLRALF
jgi:hypothetical protein